MQYEQFEKGDCHFDCSVKEPYYGIFISRHGGNKVWLVFIVNRIAAGAGIAAYIMQSLPIAVEIAYQACKPARVPETASDEYFPSFNRCLSMGQNRLDGWNRSLVPIFSVFL
jgi:hypothetical protein